MAFAPMDYAASSALSSPSPWCSAPATQADPDDSPWWPSFGKAGTPFAPEPARQAPPADVCADDDDVCMAPASSASPPPPNASSFDEAAFVASFFVGGVAPQPAGAAQDTSETDSLRVHLDAMMSPQRAPPVPAPTQRAAAPEPSRVAPAAPFRFSVVVPGNTNGACVARAAESVVARDASGRAFRVATVVVRSRSGMRKVHTQRGTEIGNKFPALTRDDCKIALEHEAAADTDVPGVQLVVRSVTATGRGRKEVNADRDALLIQWKRSQGQRQEDTLAEFVAELRGGCGPNAWVRPVASLDLLDSNGRALRGWVRRV